MEYLQSLSTAERDYYCEVIKLVKLILVMPATNAVSEQSFSALRRLKTWLRSTTNQARLNWSMILHIHKERTDRLPMLSVANELSSRNDSRIRLFGQFRPLQYDSLFPLSSGSLRHAGGRFIIHYSLSLYVLES